MRIAVWHNLPSGGGKRALFDHINGLIQRGHKIEAWCPSTANVSYLPLNTIVKEHIIPLSLHFGSSNSGRFSFKHLSMSQKLRAMNQHCQICADAINGGNFDLLFANTGLYFHTTSIGHRVNIPSVLYLQEPARWLYEANPYLPWVALPSKGLARLLPRHAVEFIRDAIKIRRVRMLAREEAYNARGFDRILVNSYFSRESIIRNYGVDAKTCYLGIDTEKFFDYRIIRDNFVIGVGSITPAKNIELVIKSISRVKSNRPNLVWVGNAVDQPYLNYVQRLAEQLNVMLECKVMISDNDLIELLNKASLMVYTPRLEPYGYAPLEAGACGLPVIGIAEGGLRETIQDGVNGFLVEAEPDAISHAISRILAEPRLARELGKNARILVEEQWSLTSAIDRLEKHFLDILVYNKQNKVHK